jgi:hypothetical protein
MLPAPAAAAVYALRRAVLDARLRADLVVLGLQDLAREFETRVLLASLLQLQGVLRLLHNWNLNMPPLFYIIII